MQGAAKEFFLSKALDLKPLTSIKMDLSTCEFYRKSIFDNLS